MFVDIKDNCLKPEDLEASHFYSLQEQLTTGDHTVFFQIVLLLGQFSTKANTLAIFQVEKSYFNTSHIRCYSKPYCPSLVHLGAVF